MASANYSVAGVDRSADNGVEGEEQWAQHTSLWGTRAQCVDGRQVRSKFDCLWSFFEKVLNP